MANDLNAINAKLYGLFAGSTVITNYVGKHPIKKVWEIYYGTAPQDHHRPCLVYNLLSSNTRRGTGGRKIFNVMIYAVKLLVEGDSIAGANNILTEIENLCLGDQLTDDVLVAGMSNVGMFSYYEILEGGVRVNHVGYNIEVFTYNTN